MDIKPVTANFAVADQVTTEDLPRLQALGYRTLICNRPDGEAAGQPAAEALAEQARARGFAWEWIPISSGQFTEGAIARFDQALQAHPQPALAFCRSGTRSITLWALSQASRQPVAELLQQCAAAGYDLSAQVDALAARQRN
ncbi:TIGR01244 family sulfur transferase [Oceanimonas sp. NS1]|uniref:TIGR01244 family protein n=1 Tax=Oceanimonas doudoroffii TaxID=84158 RepID=A0A233RK03_9GAMM|nr:TIGR01244 family sulfur transferase [Oceanimonas doudoroffii]MCT7654049.1 TIGR01244 family sulfur transferase [Oceanimonas sp. NS1]OXY83718.1 TIGR01244 family protein [Oceanimonas doudoroffii]